MVQMRKRRAMIASRRVAKALVAGFGSLLTITTPAVSHYHPTSASSALNGDMAKVGRDMRVVLERERRREEASS